MQILGALSADKVGVKIFKKGDRYKARAHAIRARHVVFGKNFVNLSLCASDYRAEKSEGYFEKTLTYFENIKGFGAK